MTWLLSGSPFNPIRDMPSHFKGLTGLSCMDFAAWKLTPILLSLDHAARVIANYTKPGLPMNSPPKIHPYLGVCTLLKSNPKLQNNTLGRFNGPFEFCE